ncbi:MAG TPA: hypothetical protein VGB22_02600 [candidate division Zixibacteria bacterium]
MTAGFLYCRTSAIATWVVVALLGLFMDVWSQVNPRYRPGDWRNVTCVRYVTSYAESANTIYLGTRGGVARYDRYNQDWLPTLTNAEGLPSNAIDRLAYNPNTDELYAETDAGIAVYNPTLAEWRGTLTFPDSLASPWNSFNPLNYQLPFGYDALIPGALTDPHLRSYEYAGGMTDSWGNLWVGTWGDFVWHNEQGAFELSPQRWGLYHDNVEALHLDDSAIYFAGPNYDGPEGALSIYDTLQKEWQWIEARYTSGFQTDRITQFAGVRGGRFLWMATPDGLIRFDRANTEFRTYRKRDGLSDERVYGLCLDGDILWIGTEVGVDGLYLVNDSVFSATSPSVDNARVYTIEATGEVVWLGTDRGLYRLAKPVPEWFAFNDGTGPLSGVIRAMAHDDRTLYVGSDRGLALVDLDGSKPVRLFENPSVLPADDIYALAVTDTIVWAGTPSGLLRFVPATLETRLFTPADGMPDYTVQAIAVDGDYLWLGTPEGASRFCWNNPSRID